MFFLSNVNKAILGCFFIQYSSIKYNDTQINSIWLSEFFLKLKFLN